MRDSLRFGVILLAAVVAAGGAMAQDDKPAKEFGWFNTTDLSLVVTSGNSNTETIGFKDTLQRKWEKARFQLKVDAVRSDTADDRFAEVDVAALPPGFDPANPPPGFDYPFIVISPSREPDVARYLVEARYDKNITDKFFWNVGGSWDRNEDAGIDNRYIGFAGLGNIFYDREDLKFRTNYALSYTDREETPTDPLKDDSFAGVRIDWEYLNKFGKNTTYENLFTGNMNLGDTSDYNLDMTNALSVSMSAHLALKVALRWQYAALPAFETIDLFVDLSDFDPALLPGPVYAQVGTEDIRKKELDTTFTTSLVINF